MSGGGTGRRDRCRSVRGLSRETSGATAGCTVRDRAGRQLTSNLILSGPVRALDLVNILPFRLDPRYDCMHHVAIERSFPRWSV